MVEDVHMADSNALVPLQLMLNHKRYKTPSGYMNLKNIKFLFTATTIPDSLQQSTLRLQLGVDAEQVKAIFATLLRQNIDS
jgi:hypothetical protein